MKPANETQRAELRVAPHYAQGQEEDGYYCYQKGWVIEARMPVTRGDAIYTYQKETYPLDQPERADSRIETLCGSPANGFWCNITDDSEDWMLTGASY